MTTMRAQISLNLLNEASYYYYDINTDIEYLISTETTEMNDITFSASRDSQEFENRIFADITSLLNFLDNEDIDVEKFQKYDYKEQSFLDIQKGDSKIKRNLRKRTKKGQVVII